VRIEPFGPIVRREHQRRDLIGHLIQHLPLRPIQVGGSDQHDRPIGAAFTMFDRKESRGLAIPEAQTVKRSQVAALDFGQRLPAIGFSKTCQRTPAFQDIRKTQSVACQLSMQGLQ